MHVLGSLPPAPLIVAAGQASCEGLSIEANVKVAADLVRRGAELGADLVVLPELFLTGYELEAISADPERHCVADDGRLGPLSQACATTRTAAVIGAPTRDVGSGELHISALVLDRSGRLTSTYHKQHVDVDERSFGFCPGESAMTLVLDGWRLGLGICRDLSFPDHCRTTALAGAHAYLVGAMFDENDGAHRRATVSPARALDNASYVVLANHCGRSGPLVGCGHSAVWNPDGTLLVDADVADPGLAVARLQPEVIDRARSGEHPLSATSLGSPSSEPCEVVVS